MPIDEFILGPMITPYENMIKDVDSRSISNEHTEEMKNLFKRMQELGQEHSDISEFTGICMQEDLFGKFGILYGQAITPQPTEGSADPADYDDAALLKQTVSALKQSIDQIRQSKEAALKEASKDPKENLANEAAFARRFAAQHGIDSQGIDIEKAQSANIDKQIAKNPNAYNNSAEIEVLDNSEDLIKPIQDLIDLGEQEGMTFPDYLRIQIEKGLDKAMEGSVSTRKGLEYSLNWAKASMTSPFHIEKCQKHLDVFDKLASEQKFGVPNWKQLKWATNDVDYEFEPGMGKWAEITSRWESILDDIHDWSLAYCSHAGYVDPWKDIAVSRKPKAIQKSKDILPGIIKQKERLLLKYFGISFQDIFTHETFNWAIETNSIYHSKEFIEFLKEKVYQTCVPLQHMPDELIAERERLSKEDREVNPKLTEPAERTKKFYDSKFGEGRFVSKFGEITPVESNAAPWN
ncbi:MAG: hypothetical protein ABUK01_05510 [Leptospirales bacterium]